MQWTQWEICRNVDFLLPQRWHEMELRLFNDTGVIAEQILNLKWHECLLRFYRYVCLASVRVLRFFKGFKWVEKFNVFCIIFLIFKQILNIFTLPIKLLINWHAITSTTSYILNRIIQTVKLSLKLPRLIKYRWKCKICLESTINTTTALAYFLSPLIN